MALFADTVSREMYDDMRQQRDDAWKRYDTLFESYKNLRPMQSPVNPVKVIPPKPDSATQTLDAMEQSVRDPRIEAAVKRLMAEEPSLSAAAALREAKKLLDVATGKADPPAIAMGSALL